MYEFMEFIGLCDKYNKKFRSIMTSALNRSKSKQNLYATQSERLHKTMRLMDLNIDEPAQKKNLNFVVVGPKNSGKKSLLQTLSYAVNNMETPRKQEIGTGLITFEKYEIKRGKKTKIDGLTAIKELNDQIYINGYKMKGQQNMKIALQCLKKYNSNKDFNLVIICLSTAEILDNESLSCTLAILKTLRKNEIHYMIVGTNIDQIIGDDSEEEKALMISDWRDYIQSVLKIQEKRDIFCLQNYVSIKSGRVSACSEINYYALSLIERCLDKIQKEEKPKEHYFNFWCFGACS